MRDLRLLKHLLRYLRGCPDLVLIHRCGDAPDASIIRAQCDSDWAGNRRSRRSTTSCGFVWWSNVLVCSFARTQSVVATSSPESEYYGACAT
eukprot:4272521-Amphidinium_carterae.1